MQPPLVFIAYEPQAGLRCALAYLRSGLARRGWLERSDVVDTRKLADLRALLGSA